MKIAVKLFFCSLIVISMNACYYDVEEELYPASSAVQCDTLNNTYALKILPMISSNCYNCHSSTSNQGNVNLDGYNNLKIYVDNGKLFGALNHDPGYSAMPKGGNKLSTCQIASVKTWINQGSPNN